jgi:hypothetical protein
MLHVYFNELSIVITESRDEAAAYLRLFAQCLATINRASAGCALVSKEDFNGRPLCINYNYDQWRNEAKNRDFGLLISRLMSKAPAYDFSSIDANNTSIFEVDGQVPYGLAAAYLEDGLCVSVGTLARFRQNSVAMLEYELSRASSAEEVAEIFVRNDWCAEELAHLEWIESRRDELDRNLLAAISSASELVEACEALFFIPHAVKQLENMDGSEWPSAVRALIRLNQTAKEWREGGSDSPAWRSKVTPESQSRVDRGLVRFEDTDGIRYDFGYHARYTPGAGRIHFRMDEHERNFRIAYVGLKIV